ncbi:MAG: TIGR03086 family protein [Acidimicrobiales bacterium]
MIDTVAAVGRGENIFAIADQPLAPDDEWLDRFDANRADLDAAWETGAALDQPTLVPWASDSGAVALVNYVNEVTVHTWDLATATGQHPFWNPSVLEMAAPGNGFALPAENRAALFAEFTKHLPPEYSNVPDPFLDAVPVPDDAPLIDRIVGWSGRRP